MVKKYIDFINERDEAEVPDEINLDTPKKEDSPNEDTSDKSDFTESTSAVKELIDGTIEKSGGEFESFKESFLKDPKETKIEGLINDSDIYDFYLKYRNDIDEMLGDINFYDEVPSENNVFGLYDYVIQGTMKAVEEFVKKI